MTNNQRYVLVVNGAVADTALWDGVSSWPLENGQVAVRSDNADIGWTYTDGTFTKPLEPDPISPTILELIKGIDVAADSARLTVAGDPLRAVEYDRARIEAEAFKAVDYQGEVPRTVAAWAINGRTAQQATDSILAEAAAYTEALYCIREIRLQAKELVRTHMANGEQAQAEDVAAEAIATIEALVAGVGNAPA